MNSLGTEDFPRVRLGVANESRGRRIHDFVLDRFSPDEEERLDAFLDAAVDALQVAIRQGLTAAMNRFNRNRDVL
jgi:PTH1 family peptidyl-tRNA hydrolase